MAIHRGEFINIDGDSYCIDNTETFTRTRPASADYEYKVSQGFKLQYNPSGQGEILAPSFPSSVTYTLVVESSSAYTNIKTMYEDNADDWYTIIYKKPAGSETWSVYWWGFLQMETSSETYEYYPQRIKFESFDLLTFAGTQNLWDYQHTLNKWSTLYSFGNRSNQDPTSTTQYRSGHANTWDAYSPEYRTFLGVVFGLVHDSVITMLAKHTIKVMNWDTITSPSADIGDRFLWYLNYLDIDLTLLDWVPPPPQGGGSMTDYPEDAKRDVNALDFLNELMTFVRARIFQHEGDYYITQWEAYQGNPTDGGAKLQVHDNRLINSPNYPTGSLMRYPQWLSEESLSSTEFITQIDHPRTDPALLSGASFSFNQSSSYVEWKRPRNPWQRDDVMVTKFGLSNTTLPINAYNNFTAANNINDPVHFQHVTNDSISNWQLPAGAPMSYRYDGTTMVYGSIRDHIYRARAAYQNGIRRKLNAQLKGTHSFFKGILHDTITYIHTGYQFHAAENVHQIEAVELVNNQDSLGEPITGGGAGGSGGG